MRSKSRLFLPILSLFISASLAMAATTQPETAAPASAPALGGAESQPAAEINPAQPVAPISVGAENPIPKTDTIVVRLKAPLLSPNFSTTPLATVNDELITFDDLKAALGVIHTGMSEGKAAPKKNFSEILERLINSKLIIQEARTIGLEKDETIQSSMVEFKKDLMREILLNKHVKDLAADAKEVEKVYRERIKEWRLKSLIIAKKADVKAFEAEIKAGKPFDTVYENFIKEERGKKGGNTEDYIARDAINPAMMVALEKMKVGETGTPVAIEKGYVLYRVEEIRSKEDPKLLEQLQQEMGSQVRLAELKKYQEKLTKKYVKMKKLFKTLDYENPKNKFDKMLKDKRVIADIKGEKSLTVADFSDAVAAEFFHGVQRAIESKKVNSQKSAILEQLLGKRVLDMEARLLKIDQSDEFREKVKSKEDSILFGTFMQKVVIPEITITRDEAKAYYAEHAKEYFAPGSYLLDAIAFSSPEKAEEAVKTLKNGTDFQWYKANADDQESIDLRLHAFFDGNHANKEELPIKMQQALSGSINGDYRVFKDGTIGYAIAVLEYQPPATRPYEQVEGVVSEALSYDKLNKSIESWAMKLRASSEVTVYADFTQQEKP